MQNPALVAVLPPRLVVRYPMHRSPRFRTATGAALGVLLLAACAAAPEREAAGTAPEPAPEPAAEIEPEPVYRPFPKDTLYALLVAEFAARRGAFAVALENYLRQAAATRDPAVAAHATRIARYLNAEPAALQAALLWVDIEPAQPEARYMAATELARAGRAPEAFRHMLELYRQTGTGNFAGIAASALDAPEAQRRDMLAQLEELGDSDEPDLLAARALLLQSLGENEAALGFTGRLLEQEPDDAQAMLIEAQIYQNLGEIDKAYARIERALESEPGNKRLRLQYAGLVAKTDPARAEEQFRILLDSDPDDAEMRLSLALLYRQTDQHARMRDELEELLRRDVETAAAHFYLGEEAERREAIDAAIDHYLAVEPSPLYPAALKRAGELIHEHRGAGAYAAAIAGARERWPDQSVRTVLIDAELRTERRDYDGAWKVLSAALAAHPEEPGLLYARSMVSEKRRDIPALERDLREMLRLQPDSALALNALGYSLTNLTDRHEEALELIRRALELQPQDPAILDSMGWVHYRLGDPRTALGYLQDAFERFPDHEVAAHLGEVLWALGRTEEARSVWDKGLDARPGSPIILDAMQRLGALPRSPE